MPSVSTVVGALACQRNSFLKSLQTSVVSCQKYAPIVKDKKKKQEDKKDEFAIEFEDTILFPEGGGQPFDTGRAVFGDKTVEIFRVLRDKLSALHIAEEPIEPGTKVLLEVDWDRRIDLMQQHTGQHLLSAVFDTYDLETLSWSMGDTINYIELPRKVDDKTVAEVNRKVNELILQNIAIHVTTPDDHGGEVDVSHIPEDYDLLKGIIRIVKIGDIDANPCCGTHLQSTGQIQSIALLHQVNIRGGNSRLHFTCGARVYQYLVKEHFILKNIQGNYLSCQLDEVVDKVDALNLNYKKSTQRETSLLKELALIEAGKIFKLFTNGDSDVGLVYRPDPNPEYLLLFQKEFSTLVNTNKDSGVNLDKFTLVLINGERNTGGMVKVLGPKAEALLADIKSRFSNIKGGGKGTSFQGKVAKYEKDELEGFFKSLE